MSRFVYPAARVLIALMLLGTVAVQILIPIIAIYEADYAPEFAHLLWPMTVLAILAIVCAQVVLVAMWQLVTLTQRDSVFSPHAFRWVDVVIGASLAAAGIIAIVFVWLALTPGVGPILVFGMVLAAMIFCLAAAVLMVIMRRLLAQAAGMREYLAEVV